MRSIGAALACVFLVGLLEPSATAEQPSAEPILQRIDVFFHTNDNDKDHDTRLKVVITDRNGGEVADVEGEFGQFKDNTDHGPFPMRVKVPAPVSLINGGLTTMTIDPNGDDTWKFNLRLVMHFSNSEPKHFDFGGTEMSEEATVKVWRTVVYAGEYGRMNFEWIPQPTDVLGSTRGDYARRIPPLLWETCVQGENTGRGEGSLTHVMATASLLRLIEDPTGRAELGAALGGNSPLIPDEPLLYRDCLDRHAPGWRPPALGHRDHLNTTPGWQIVIADLMRVPAFTGKPGTDAMPGCRVGGGDTDDWDVTMALVMRVWGMMRTESPAVLFGPEDPGSHAAKFDTLKKEIASRAWLQGGTSKYDVGICTVLGARVPETENHTLLIRSTRFLHNESLPLLPTPSHKPEYVEMYNTDPNPDNRTNGVLGYIEDFTNGVMKDDFLEYNARPYGRFQMYGLLNLYEFAENPAVRTAAKRVLDFLALKHAAESRDNRRITPYRRIQDTQSPVMIKGGTPDSMFEVWVGGLAQPVNPQAGPTTPSGEMALAASASYRPPTWMPDLMFDRRHRDYLQFFNGRNHQEVAYGGPDFTLTGGGRITPCPYPGTVIDLCAGSGNDKGTTEPIVLIPHQRRADGQDVHNQPSYRNEVRLESRWGEHKSCLERNVACGEYLMVGDNVVRDHPDCKQTFVQQGQQNSYGLRFDGSCSPPGGPSYEANCFFAYGGGTKNLTEEVPQLAYLVTHSCDPAMDEPARKKAFTSFVEYMRTVGAPAYAGEACPRWPGLRATVKQPPADKIDLTGETGGRTVTMVGNDCDDLPGYSMKIDGRPSYQGAGLITGDLSLTGGRVPATIMSLRSTPEHVSVFGEPVRFIATARDPGGRAGLSGTMTFLDGATVLATIPVTPGPDGAVFARYETGALPLGSRRITAVYSGDARFSAATATEPHHVGATLDRAKALNLEGRNLWTQGVRDQAITKVMEAMALIRELAAADPAHRRLMAEWLAFPVSTFHAAAGRYDEAVALGNEGIEMFTQLIRENPGDDALVHGLATSQRVVAGSLWDKPELREQAVRLALDAVATIRPLADRNPFYRRQLAEWLSSPASVFLAGTGRFAEAATAGDESIAMFTQLVKEDPVRDDYVSGLAIAQVNLATGLWPSPEHRARSAGLALDGVTTLRPLAARNAGYRPRLGDWILWPTIPYLVEAGRKPEAITLAREAVGIFTELEKIDPVTYGPKLAQARQTLADLER
ncbi:Ig-like domain-containing protein [Herbihabitans rhizosphaerae]|uniref:Ig-like domain-containing protein n=1 Tax=Herbihabitans rhizosphaerae TaxID=1872711 RepID=UPI0013EEA13E|nr:Ig-like domain-containing protein [Herbihabitans rhizosphaerae]